MQLGRLVPLFGLLPRPEKRERGASQGLLATSKLASKKESSRERDARLKASLPEVLLLQILRLNYNPPTFKTGILPLDNGQ